MTTLTQTSWTSTTSYEVGHFVHSHSRNAFVYKSNTAAFFHTSVTRCVSFVSFNLVVKALPELHTNTLRSSCPEGEIPRPAGSDRRDQVSFMDGLVQRLALMALIEEEDARAPAKPSRVAQVYRLFPAYGTPATRSNGFNVGPHEVKHGLYTGHGSMVTHVTPMNPVQHYAFAKPVHPAKVDMSTTKMNNMSQLPGRRMYFQNQLLPSQGVDIQFAGYFLGDRGGTGVFIPRVSTNHVIKKKGPRNVAVRVAKQEDRHCHSEVAPSDLGLPKEWTY
ncbi:hypothetical protein Droror1_Dr00026379 [Drosera rotundifolia]